MGLRDWNGSKIRPCSSAGMDPRPWSRTERMTSSSVRRSAHPEDAPAGHRLEAVPGEVPEDLRDLITVRQTQVGPACASKSTVR